MINVLVVNSWWWPMSWGWWHCLTYLLIRFNTNMMWIVMLLKSHDDWIIFCNFAWYKDCADTTNNRCKDDGNGAVSLSLTCFCNQNFLWRDHSDRNLFVKIIWRGTKTHSYTQAHSYTPQTHVDLNTGTQKHTQKTHTDRQYLYFACLCHSWKGDEVEADQ